MINLGEKIEQEYSVGEFLVENQEKLKEIKERNDTLSDMVQQLEDCYHENLYIFKRTLSDVFLFMMKFKMIQSYQSNERNLRESLEKLSIVSKMECRVS